VAAIFVLATVAMSRQLAVDSKLIPLALLFGTLSDGGLASFHLIEYAAPSPSIPPYLGAPLWIVSLWMAFAVTLTRSLAWLMDRPALAAAFGALGGPLAYSGAARGWHALHFEPPQWRGETWLALSWALAMYLFAMIVRRSG
jgi:hypothetical protein